jgi:hypothetical protein
VPNALHIICNAMTDPSGKETLASEPAVADSVAQLVLNAYDALPKRGKPAVRDNGVPERTILAAVVAQRQGT